MATSAIASDSIPTRSTSTTAPTTPATASADQESTSTLAVASGAQEASPDDEAAESPSGQVTVVSDQAPAELMAAVDALLDSLQSKFSSVSTEIFSKMDEMSRRLDSLEESLLANNPDLPRPDSKG